MLSPYCRIIVAVIHCAHADGVIGRLGAGDIRGSGGLRLGSGARIIPLGKIRLEGLIHLCGAGVLIAVIALLGS